MRHAAVLLWAVLAALPSSGCLFFPLGGRPTAAPGGGPSPIGKGLRDFRVAFHCHSHLSHDSKVPFEKILAAAKKLGFNAVVMNDHYESGNISRSWRGLRDGVLFVPGVEIRPDALPNKKARGGLLVFGIEGDFDKNRTRTELLPELRAKGAVAAAGHCEELEGLDRYPFEAFEVYNLHAQFEAASILEIALTGILLGADPFFECHVRPLKPVLDAYDAQLLAGKRLAPLGGHDSHENVKLLGITIGTYPELLRLFSNHVLAPQLDEPSILEAVRKGRTYLSFDFLGDAIGFRMGYGPPDAAPDSLAILGDEAVFKSDSVLAVDAPAEGQIRIFRNGVVWRIGEGKSVRGPLPGPGIYRAEVHRHAADGLWRLWIFSAPIYVMGREGG